VEPGCSMASPMLRTVEEAVWVFYLRKSYGVNAAGWGLFLLAGHDTHAYQRRQAMCDYSLAAFRSRLAVEGEELVVYRFPTGALGLASPRDVESYRKEFRGWSDWFDPREIPCAVCIPPGARLLLQEIPEDLQRRLEVGATEQVVFTQKSAEAYRYRDAVRFKNRREVLLQSLNVRQRVQIMSLCAGDDGEEEHRRREEEYRQMFAEMVPVSRTHVSERADALEALRSVMDWWTVG